jgi:5-methylcytosine-specific restriction endonuclease McrA
MSYGVRKDFYQSKVWKTVRKNIWLKQNCLCAICNKPVYVDGISEWIPKENRRIGIVHHKIFLDNTNVYDENITLNEDNLIGICKECHELEHHQDIITRKEYMFDNNGNLIKRT